MWACLKGVSSLPSFHYRSAHLGYHVHKWCKTAIIFISRISLRISRLFVICLLLINSCFSGQIFNIWRLVYKFINAMLHASFCREWSLCLYIRILSFRLLGYIEINRFVFYLICVSTCSLNITHARSIYSFDEVISLACTRRESSTCGCRRGGGGVSHVKMKTALSNIQIKPVSFIRELLYDIW